MHHNYFCNHSFSGANGGESIRLGFSRKQSKSAYAIIEHNLFEKANGDSEAISVKASDNTIRHNTIRASLGCIVLRHGHRTTVEGNLLFGSGIRFHGNDHKIYNNGRPEAGARRQRPSAPGVRQSGDRRVRGRVLVRETRSRAPASRTSARTSTARQRPASR